MDTPPDAERSAEQGSRDHRFGPCLNTYRGQIASGDRANSCDFADWRSPASDRQSGTLHPSVSNVSLMRRRDHRNQVAALGSLTFNLGSGPIKGLPVLSVS